MWGKFLQTFLYSCQRLSSMLLLLLVVLFGSCFHSCHSSSQRRVRKLFSTSPHRIFSMYFWTLVPVTWKIWDVFGWFEISSWNHPHIFSPHSSSTSIPNILNVSVLTYHSFFLDILKIQRLSLCWRHVGEVAGEMWG